MLSVVYESRDKIAPFAICEAANTCGSTLRLWGRRYRSAHCQTGAFSAEAVDASFIGRP